MISDYVSSTLSFDEVQFAVSIALDNLGAEKAAKKVLRLFQSDSPTEVLEIRDYVIKNSITIVKDFIAMLFTKKVIPTKKNRMYSVYEYGVITDVLDEVILTEKQIYNSTMQIIALHDKTDFIILYQDTNMWLSFFKPRIKQRGPTITDDIKNDIVSAFKDFTRKYSANGSYSVSSKTPEAFLINTYNQYFSKSREYFNTMNRRGVLDSINDESKASLVDIRMDDAVDDSDLPIYSRDNGIDFLNIANKIYDASKSLFKHGSENKPLDCDIFSWYKFDRAKNAIKAHSVALGKLKEVYTVDYSATPFDIDNPTEKTKFQKRFPVCEKYMGIVNSSFSSEDIYNIYEEMYRFQATVAGRDREGLYIFRNKIGENSLNFQKHLEGFAALKDLVNFLESSRNNTGISVSNFPVNIFRDAKLLNRFQSLEEYLMLCHDTEKLIKEVDTDSIRSSAIGEGNLQKNEVINYKLQTAITSKNDFNTLYTKFLELNLSKGESAIKKSMSDIINEEIVQPIYKFNRNLDVHQVLHYKEQLSQETTNRSLGSQLLQLTTKAIRVLNGLKAENLSRQAKANLALSYIMLLDNFLEAADCPIDNAAISTINNRNISELLRDAGVKEREKFIIASKNGPIIKENFPYIDYLTAAFNDSVNIIFEDDASDADLETVFNVSRINNGILQKLLAFSDEALQLLKSFENKDITKEGYYLYFAKLLSCHKIIKLGFPINSVSSVINFMYKSYVIQQSFNFDLSYGERQQKRSKIVLKAVNDFLLTYKDLFMIMKNFNRLTNDVLRTSGYATGISSAEYNRLVKMNARLVANEPDLGKVGEIMRITANHNCYFGEDGYLMRYNDYVKLGEQYYIHKQGYKVDTGLRANTDLEYKPAFKALTDTDLYNLEIRVMMF